MLSSSDYKFVKIIRMLCCVMANLPHLSKDSFHQLSGKSTLSYFPIQREVIWKLPKTRVVMYQTREGVFHEISKH